MTGATGLTFLEYAVNRVNVNIALKSGGNVVGAITGYDGVFVYVKYTAADPNWPNKTVGVPVENIQLAVLTS